MHRTRMSLGWAQGSLYSRSLARGENTMHAHTARVLLYTNRPLFKFRCSLRSRPFDNSPRVAQSRCKVVLYTASSTSYICPRPVMDESGTASTHFSRS